VALTDVARDPGGYQVYLAASGSEALDRGVACDHALITSTAFFRPSMGIAVMLQLRPTCVAATC